MHTNIEYQHKQEKLFLTIYAYNLKVFQPFFGYDE